MDGTGEMFRLKANKTSFYKLVGAYEELPPMRRVNFTKAYGTPDWITSLERKHVLVDPDPVFVIEDGGPDTFLDDMGTTIPRHRAGPEEESRDLPIAFAPRRRTCQQAGESIQRQAGGE